MAVFYVNRKAVRHEPAGSCLTTSESETKVSRSALADERSGTSIALSNVEDSPVTSTNKTNPTARVGFFLPSDLIYHPPAPPRQIPFIAHQSYSRNQQRHQIVQDTICN